MRFIHWKVKVQTIGLNLYNMEDIMSNLCLSCSHYNKTLCTCSAGKSMFEASTTGVCTAYLTKKYRYTFKRDVYTRLEEAIAANEVTFVLGPRKSGKTVCLHQYEHEHNNVV